MLDQPIRILHLSDGHFRVGKGWDADQVTRGLARFIKAEVESGLLPDLVAFTGDLAFSGSPEEYALAQMWLEGQLWPAFPDLSRDRLLLIPGNHDVARSKVSRGVRSMQDGLLSARTQEDIAALLGDDDDRHNMLRRHAAYMDFVAGWYGEPQPLPWWQRMIEIRRTRLHVAGLDSAWMSCGDDDRGRLLLGRYQLTQTVVTEQAGAADWRIVLVHHPWSYLAEFESDDARDQVHHHTDLVLRGHLHRQRSERVLPPDPTRQCLELAAGCVYEHSQYPNAFQWIELATAGTRVRVLYRAWLHDAWSVDRNQPGCPDGHAEFELGAQPTADRLHRSASPSIPAAYLDWLQARCASVELLGQDIKQSHAFKLDHVYVPALTHTMTATAMIGARDDVESAREGSPLKGVAPLLGIVDRASAYVPAPAGAGKSTFCRWAVLRSIPDARTSHPIPTPEGYEEPVPAALQSRLPVLVPLSEFCKDMDCARGKVGWYRSDLERALSAWIDKSPPPGLSGALLSDHLAAGSAFLLLDGLDEVPVSEVREGTMVYPRALLLSGLTDALPAWQAAANRIVLTSRPYGLDEAGLARFGLERAALEPLPERLQALFVRRWFHTLDREELARQLIEAVKAREDLAPLTENPMLLTAICVLYDKGGRLPEDRYELYRSIVDGVLHSRYPGDAREREPVLRRLEAIAHGLHLGEPGGAPRQTPAAEISWVETERLLADFAEQNPSLGRGEVAAAIQREELLTRSGLLVPRPNQRAAFYHLSFQEFLAAQRVARAGDARVGQVVRERVAVPEWRPTLLFLFAAQLFNRDPEWGMALLADLLAGQDRATVRANPATAGFIAEALELCLAKGYQVPDGLAKAFRQLALDAIVDEIEIRDRQVVGLCLGRLGDPRIFDLRDLRAYVEVPAGTYSQREEDGPFEIAAPFRIGRYPVTNSQYQTFMDDGGYRQPGKWWSKAGLDWLREEGVAEPLYWHDRAWNGPNQPVIGVSFWEAEACAAWAGGRLPSEQEWEAAARDPEGCKYPWGKDWKNGICNTFDAGLGVTSAVGLFPNSRQARLGIEDLIGNVVEWCGRLKEGSELPRAGLGGHWGSRQQDLAHGIPLGFWLLPTLRYSYVGFRVLLP